MPYNWQSHYWADTMLWDHDCKCHVLLRRWNFEVTKDWTKTTWEGNGLFPLVICKSIIRTRAQGSNLGSEADRYHGGMLLLAWPSWLTHLLSYRTHLVWAVPPWINHQLGKCTSGLPRGQSVGNIFSGEVSSSKTDSSLYPVDIKVVSTPIFQFLHICSIPWVIEGMI